MDRLSFIADLVRSLAWPLALVVLILIVREPLGRLLRLLQRLKYGQLELEFGKRVEEAKEEVTRELPAETEVGLAGDESLALARLAEVSPRSAVLEAWRSVELVTLEAARAIGGESLSSRRSTSQAIRLLEHTESLNRNVISLLRDLRGLRNEAAHAPGFALTKESALEYASMAAAVARYLRNMCHGA